MKVWPAIVTVPKRATAQAGLAVAVTVTELLPVPLVGVTESQMSFAVALQAQPAVVVTVTAWLPPAAAGLQLVGLSVKVPAAPAA